MQYDTLIYTDDLTGLKNRRYLEKLREELIPSLIKRKEPFTIAVCDLDHFKEVNDTYGHLKGDEVIKDFGKFLKNNLRKQDEIIRYGGDEFVIIQEGLSARNSRRIWQQIIENMQQSELAGLKIGMSAGLASYPEDGEDFESLFKEADSRLYIAKRSGRGRIGEKHDKKLNFESYGFVNREKEKATLTTVIQKNGVVLIKGPVGIGKTRLVKEVVGKTKGREILWSTCMPFNFGIPYYPIRELLKYKLQRTGTDFINNIPIPYRIEVGKIVPQVLENIDREQLAGYNEMLDRYRLYEGIKKVLFYGDRPRIVVIDDIQWIDENSIEVLEYLIKTSKEAGITYIFASRIEEENLQAEDFIRRISREKYTEYINLQPLAQKHIKEMVTFITSEKVKGLGEYVFEKSGGNPFFVEEILKELYEHNFLITEDSRWVFNPPVKEIVPKSVEDVIERKLRTLSNEALEILQSASILGDIDIEVLKEISGFNEGHIIGLLEEAVREGILKETDETVKFSDEVTREIIYSKHLSNLKKRMLHRKAGTILLKLYKDRENEIAEKLAFHFKEARMYEECVKYSILAGDRAKVMYANKDAIRYYSDALLCLEQLSSEDTWKDRLKALKRRSMVRRLIADYENALSDINSALEIAVQHGEKIEEAHCYEILSDIYTSMGDFEKELEMARKAYEIHKELGRKHGMAQDINLMGIAHYNTGDYKRAIELFEESLKLNKEVNYKENLASAYNNLGVIYNEVLMEYSKALEYLEKALKLRRSLNDREGVGATYNNLGILYENMGEFEKAIEYYTKSLEVSKEIGDVEGEIIAILNIGVVHEELNHYEKALEYYHKSLKLSEKYNIKAFTNVIVNNIGALYRATGKYVESLNYCKEALVLSEELNDKKGILTAYQCMGDVYFDTGNYEKAEENYLKCYELSKNIADKEGLQNVLLALGELYSESGKLEQARKVYDELGEITNTETQSPAQVSYYLALADLALSEKDVKKCEEYLAKVKETAAHKPTQFASWYILMGRLLSLKGQIDESTRYFEEGINLYEKTGSKHAKARSLYYFGIATKNKDLIDKAMQIFKELGAIGWLERLKSPKF